jgi:TfoX/Sxy family transcriptional regulator of competence genes
MSSGTVEERFGALVGALAGKDGVALGTGKRGFGSDALQVGGRIFAMVTSGRVVLKLPRERVRDLIEAGKGAPFDAGKGRPMQEWVALEAVDWDDLLQLAREARGFVSRSASPTSRR